MIALILSVLIPFTQGSLSSPTFTFIEDSAKGTLTLMEGTVPVLTYRYGDQLPEDLDVKFARSCYIHPLYSTDGRILTADFPADHIHHHGVFWTWPAVKTRSRNTQTWHPDDLRQYFSRWIKREIQGQVAVLIVENDWKLDSEEVVAREVVAVHVHPSREGSRIIDFEIVLQAVGGELELRGAPDQNKGYGGLSIRCAPEFTGAVMTTNSGILNDDSVNVPFLWAGLSTDRAGIAIFVAPYHRKSPLPWLIRNSYSGFLNPSWPGLTPVVLEPGEPVTLSYRLFTHQGSAEDGQVKEAYDRFLVDCRKRNNQESVRE